MKRKLLLTALSAVCLGACAAGLSACDLFGPKSSDAIVDGIKYELDGDAYTVVGYENADDSREQLIIPASIKGIAVTEIERFAFEGNTSLKTIVIPESVTDVDVGAFRGCTSVESMTLPYVTTKGGGWDISYHFSDNANAENKDVVPATLKSIELLCETRLSGSNFKDCTALETVILPDTLAYVGRYVFENCTSLKSIVIPDSVTRIEYAFTGCTSLESISLPHIGEYRDPSESSGTPRTNFGFIFEGTSANGGIPESLKTVKVTAATEIAREAFKGCSDIENVILPESLTEIGAMAFMNCTSLKSVNIPGKVTEIDGAVFLGCKELEITIPSNVTSIRQEAFKNCTDLKITLSEGLLSIGNDAFANCENLKISIPLSVKTIASGAFAGCTKAVTEEDGLSYVDKWFIGGHKDGTVNLKAGTVGIATYAITDAVNVITIPDSVRYMSASAFRYAKGLKVNYGGDLASWCKIVFGDSDANPLTSATDLKILYNGEYVSALTVKDNLTALEIPDGVTQINKDAFVYYSALEAVYIPKSVTKISADAFYYCNNLVDIFFGGTRTEWEAVEKEENWDRGVGGSKGYTVHCTDDEE